MTDRLSEIEARAHAATEGPWTDDGDVVAGGRLDAEIAFLGESESSEWQHDVAFIAHARSDVPWLVARVRELETVMREALEALLDDLGHVQWHQQHPERVAEDCIVCTVSAALAPAEQALPCGHPFAAAVHAGEGTSYCGACGAEQEGQR